MKSMTFHPSLMQEFQFNINPMAIILSVASTMKTYVNIRSMISMTLFFTVNESRSEQSNRVSRIMLVTIKNAMKRSNHLYKLISLTYFHLISHTIFIRNLLSTLNKNKEFGEKQYDLLCTTNFPILDFKYFQLRSCIKSNSSRSIMPQSRSS